MDLQKIKALIDLVSESRLTELELVEGEDRLRIVRAARSDVAPPAACSLSPTHTLDQARGSPTPGARSGPSTLATAETAAGSTGHVVKAPMFGVVHLSPAPGEPSFVRVGDDVREGQKLCVIEAMKSLNVIEADRAGRIAGILVQGGQEVDVGQALFRIESR